MRGPEYNYHYPLVAITWHGGSTYNSSRCFELVLQDVSCVLSGICATRLPFMDNVRVITWAILPERRTILCRQLLRVCERVLKSACKLALDTELKETHSLWAISLTSVAYVRACDAEHMQVTVDSERNLFPAAAVQMATLVQSLLKGLFVLKLETGQPQKWMSRAGTIRPAPLTQGLQGCRPPHFFSGALRLRCRVVLGKEPRMHTY